MKFPSEIKVINVGPYRRVRRSGRTNFEIVNGNIIEYLMESRVTPIAVYRLVSQKKIKLKTITEEVK